MAFGLLRVRGKLCRKANGQFARCHGKIKRGGRRKRSKR